MSIESDLDEAKANAYKSVYESHMGALDQELAALKQALGLKS